MTCSNQDWINVEDRLPENGKRVLVYSSNYDIDDVMAIRILDSQFIRISLSGTHWMPLPEPPNDSV